VHDAAEAQSDALVFLDSAFASAAESPYEDAERVRAILDPMARVARRRRDGVLGTSIREALADLGIDYRPTIARNTSARLREQYRFVHLSRPDRAVHDIRSCSRAGRPAARATNSRRFRHRENLLLRHGHGVHFARVLLNGCDEILIAGRPDHLAAVAGYLFGRHRPPPSLLVVEDAHGHYTSGRLALGRRWIGKSLE
jgi:hypothetical protein